MVNRLTWQEIAIEVEKLHSKCLSLNPDWTIADTANRVNRAHGDVSQYIQLATFMRSHPKIADIKNKVKALEFMRQKKLEMRTSAWMR